MNHINHVTLPKMSDDQLLAAIEDMQERIKNDRIAVEKHGEAAVYWSDGKMPERLEMAMAELERRTA